MSKNKFPPRRRSQSETATPPLHVYGLHAVRAALNNKARVKKSLLVTKNALDRLTEDGPVGDVAVTIVAPKKLDNLLGADAVHQGVALEVEPLARLELGALDGASLVLVLDQITDPHNVGAIARTACAFGADAIITTARHSPRETGILAKSASGALDLIKFIEVPNLGQTLSDLKGLDFCCLGFDSEAPNPLAPPLDYPRLAIVLGAEGKGLRRKTRALCDLMVRLDMAGPIKSLNVSNAAAIALFAATRSGN
jgi:23S rRNA (guanosine2251-2'-O)-methyltransferase